MLSLVEAKHYKCLEYIRQPLNGFHILVGPNASGKSTFFDTVAFLADVVSEGPEGAVYNRTANFADLVWGREATGFELALEAWIPEHLRQMLPNKNGDFDTVRYEIVLGADEEHPFGIDEEALTLLERGQKQPRRQLDIFPERRQPPETIIRRQAAKKKAVVRKKPGGNDNFYSEVYPQSGKGWAPSFKLGRTKSALGNLPADEAKFPVATWFRDFLKTGVQPLELHSAVLRKPSPPGQGKVFKPDASNLPWVVERLKRERPVEWSDWLGHLRTALPDLRDIRTVEREEDRHRYLIVEYSGGLSVPSWMVSDGTLRLLVLTLPAYIPDLGGVFLVEEPENGVHPRAIETMYQSFSSMYEAQILVATHSPALLSLARPEEVLCFAKTPDGAVDLVPGDEHPALREWHGDVNLSLLFASGVLG